MSRDGVRGEKGKLTKGRGKGQRAGVREKNESVSVRESIRKFMLHLAKTSSSSCLSHGHT